METFFKVSNSKTSLINYVFRSNFSVTASKDAKHYKMVIAGGGTGGTSMASRFAKKFGAGKVAVVEPNEVSLNLKKFPRHNNIHILRLQLYLLGSENELLLLRHGTIKFRAETT